MLDVHLFAICFNPPPKIPSTAAFGLSSLLNIVAFRPAAFVRDRLAKAECIRPYVPLAGMAPYFMG